MDKCLAIFIAAVSLIYAEPGEGLFFNSFILPVVFITATLYLLGFVACLIISAGAGCFYFSDISGNSTFEGVIVPLFGIFWFFVLLYWAWKTGNLNQSSRYCGSDVGGGGGFDGGGGGCDGGGE